MAGKSCRSCAVRGCDQPHGTAAANTEFLAFFKDTKHPSDDSDRTSVPAHRQGPANRPVVQQQPTQQTEPQWLLITNPAVINDRSMNSPQPQPHGARLDTTVLSCRESTPRCATSPKSARRSGPPPHLGHKRPAPFSPGTGQPIPLTIPRYLLAVAGVGGLAGHP